MQKIVPHLWFDKEAKEAANFYASSFPNSKVNGITTLQNTPSGDTDIVSFNIMGYEFMAISAGPIFKLNPAISFMVSFPSIKEVNELWEKLSVKGKILMPLDSYPFSERYGWIQDQYGVSWQLSFSSEKGDHQPPVTPSIMFVGDNYGKAEEAINLYTSIFKNAKQGTIVKYGQNQEPDKEGAIMFADFTLEDQSFAVMDSAHKHDFSFNESISFMVYCSTQEEIDYYWEKLSHVPESEQCGWLKDQYGISWQIVPTQMDEMMQKGSKEQITRVTQSFLKMKKFSILELQKAYEGK